MKIQVRQITTAKHIAADLVFKVAKSIAEMGLVDPIKVYKTSVGWYQTDEAHLLLAVRSLGWDEVEVVAMDKKDVVAEARALKSVLMRDPRMTHEQLARSLDETVGYVDEMLANLGLFDKGACTSGWCNGGEHVSECWLNGRDCRSNGCSQMEGAVQHHGCRLGNIVTVNDCTGSSCGNAGIGWIHSLDCKLTKVKGKACARCSRVATNGRKYCNNCALCKYCAATISDVQMDSHKTCVACIKRYVTCEGKCGRTVDSMNGNRCKECIFVCIKCKVGNKNSVTFCGPCNVSYTLCTRCGLVTNRASPICAACTEVKCRKCGVGLLESELENGACVNCSKPKQKCLHGHCNKLIAIPKVHSHGAFGPIYAASSYFCKAHRDGHTTIDTFPLLDRDGDEIWVTAGFSVVKVSKMEESHLTNSLNFLETAARRRAKVVGDEEAWVKYAGNRYQMLVDEARNRAKKPDPVQAEEKCPVCEDGVISTEVVDLKVTENLCPHCVRGKEKLKARQVAISIFEHKKQGKRFLLLTAAAMCASMIAAPFVFGSHEFMLLVLNYLKRMGL